MRVLALSMTYLRKPCKRPGAGRSAIEHGGDARLESDHIRIDAEVDPVLIDMRVQIDQSRRDDFAFGVEDLARLTGRNVRGDSRNFPAGNGDVADRRQFLRGIDDATAGDQEIVDR